MRETYDITGRLIRLDYQEEIDNLFGIEPIYPIIKIKVKFTDGSEILCLAERQTFLRDDSPGSLDDCEIKVWSIYNSRFTCPNHTFEYGFDRHIHLNRIKILAVMAKYANKEDAENEFKELLNSYYKEKIAINGGFMLQFLNQFKMHKIKEPVEKKLFSYLNLKDLLSLRAVCRRIGGQIIEPKRQTIHYVFNKEKDQKLHVHAVDLYRNKKYAEALKLFLRLLEVKRRDIRGLLGTTETATLEYNIGSIYLHLNDPAAVAYLRSAYNTRSYLLGEENEETKKIAAKLKLA